MRQAAEGQSFPMQVAERHRFTHGRDAGGKKGEQAGVQQQRPETFRPQKEQAARGAQANSAVHGVAGWGRGRLRSR